MEAPPHCTFRVSRGQSIRALCLVWHTTFGGNVRAVGCQIGIIKRSLHWRPKWYGNGTGCGASAIMTTITFIRYVIKPHVLAALSLSARRRGRPNFTAIAARKQKKRVSHHPAGRLPSTKRPAASRCREFFLTVS